MNHCKCADCECEVVCDTIAGVASVDSSLTSDDSEWVREYGESDGVPCLAGEVSEMMMIWPGSECPGMAGEFPDLTAYEVSISEACDDADGLIAVTAH